MLYGIGIVGLIISNIFSVYTKKKSAFPFILERFDELDEETQNKIIQGLKDEIALKLFKQNKL